MSRIALIITLAFSLGLLCIKAPAQRALPGMKGIQLTGGMVDGVYSPSIQNEAGCYFGAAMAAYTGHSNKWVFGGEYLNRYYPYKDTRIPVMQLTVEGGYYLNILSDGSKTFFLSVGGSALAGYEIVNQSKKLLSDGATLLNKDAFIYGGAVTLELEAYLCDRIVFLMTGRERALWGNTTGRFHAQFGAGIRIMVN
ncbi:conjugal transfer protein TraO [Dysgonomonas sp. GY75]|uniref:conjugal transfer protein TraO n=1 Tax=Dysgonomonas sp. GY75 TaxID=2780419 RepID=UPI001884281A|nr:conjugal transfer protein TraO [Dysgonomonas sp. GY75]MBF0649227.1 conjugal transfer protein TraO [Dysgonomonas sp. GY75]